MATKFTQVEISFDYGTTWTDVSSYCKGWNYKGILNNSADILNINFIDTIEDTYTIIEYLPIRVYEGWTTSIDRLIFRGLITVKKNEFGFLKLECADNIFKLLKTKKVSVYNKDTDPQAGVISAIAEDLMEDVDTTITQNSGTVFTLNQFISSNKTNVLERVCALAKALDYIILYDPEYNSNAGAYFFVNKGYWINSNELIIETDCTGDRPKWNSDATSLFNDLTYYGGTTSAEDQELFSGDGVTATFTLTKTPSDTVVVTVDSVLQVRGTPGVSETYDYYINKPNKTITFVTASIPAATAPNNIVIDYSSQVPPVIHLLNEESILLYNNGIDADGNLKGIPNTIIEQDITSNEDAVVRAQKLLDIYSYPFLSTVVTLKPNIDKTKNYKLGEKIQVTDNYQGIIQQEFIISEIEREWPSGGAKLTLGDKIYKIGTNDLDIKKRLDQLETELAGDYEIYADFRSVNHENEFFRKTLKITSNSVAGDYLIWDHPIYGVWDTQKWAPDSNADTGGFILGHPIYGILGTSKLGAGTSNEIILTDEDYE